MDTGKLTEVIFTELFKVCSQCNGAGEIIIPVDGEKLHYPCDGCGTLGFKLRYKYHKEVKKELGME